MGRWIDFQNDYKTLDPEFMESVWWVFKQLHLKGLVYKGLKVILLTLYIGSGFKGHAWGLLELALPSVSL
jgi:isoleucyl-tRNA synthetase